MNRRHSILVVSVLLLGMLVLFGCQSKELTSAKVYIQQDDWVKAEEQLKAAIAFDPADAEAHRLLGEAYARKGDFKAMNKELEASLEASPKFSSDVEYLRDKYWVQNFNNGIGKVNTANKAQDDTVRNQKLDAALKLFNNCLIIDPQRVDAYKNIAFVHVKRDSKDEAIKSYEKVIELDPADTKSMLQLGSLYYEQKQFEKCTVLMDKILAVEPDNLEAVSQKALAYDSMGQSDKAFDSYNNALAKNPGDPDLLFNLGRLYYMRKDYTESIDKFKQVLESVPDDYEATLNTGNAYLSLAEEIRKPIREGKELSEDQRKEIEVKAKEKYVDAVPFLEKAIELKPDNPDIGALWTNLGIAYINAGMKDKGEEAFKKAEDFK